MLVLPLVLNAFSWIIRANNLTSQIFYYSVIKKKTKLQSPLIMTCIATYIQIFHWRKPKTCYRPSGIRTGGRWDGGWDHPITSSEGKIHQKEAAGIIRAPEQQWLNHTAQARIHLNFLSGALYWTYHVALFQGFLIASGCNQYESNKRESSGHWGLVNTGSYFDTWEGVNAELQWLCPAWKLIV